MAIDLYFIHDSPPCNSIILLANTLGIELNLIPIDLEKNEHLTDSFVKMNPEHTVPTLNDNGFVVWESRAILIYLFEKYGKDDSLYPKDAQKRAVVNQRLFFDLGTFYMRLADYYYPQVFEPVKKPANPENFKKIGLAFEFLDHYLSKQTYAAGDSVTLADYALMVSANAYTGTGYDFSKYTNVVRWFAQCKSSISNWAIVEKNMDSFKNYFVNL